MVLSKILSAVSLGLPPLTAVCKLMTPMLKSQTCFKIVMTRWKRSMHVKSGIPEWPCHQNVSFSWEIQFLLLENCEHTVSSSNKRTLRVNWLTLQSSSLVISSRAPTLHELSVRSRVVENGEYSTQERDLWTSQIVSFKGFSKCKS